MATTLQIKKAIRSGLSYLEKSQQQDGAFLSQSISGNTTHQNKTLFFNAEILYYLSDTCIRCSTKRLCKKLTNYIVNQQSLAGSFNYWERGDVKNTKLPDDIDDTACALLGLSRQLNLNILTPLACRFLSLLQQQRRHGYFSTWIKSSLHPDDYDWIVQVNIRATLKQLLNLEIPPSKSQVLFNSQSKYYIDPYYQQLCLSRADLLLNKALLEESIAHPTSSWEVILSIIASKSRSSSASLAYICSKQEKSGSWKAKQTICESMGKRSSYGSSSALATALAILILQKSLLERENISDIARIENCYNKVHPENISKFIALVPSILRCELAIFMISLPKILEARRSSRSKTYTRLCGFIGLTWLNRKIDQKGGHRSDEIGQFCLNIFTKHSIKLAAKHQQKKLWDELLMYQYHPPKDLDYLQNFFRSYTKRISATLFLAELFRDSYAKKVTTLTLVVRSLSDDIHDLRIDQKTGTPTGVTSLHVHNPRNAAKISHKYVVNYCEKIFRLKPTNIQQIRLTSRCNFLIEKIYIASRCKLLKLSCERYVRNRGSLTL